MTDATRARADAVGPGDDGPTPEMVEAAVQQWKKAGKRARRLAWEAWADSGEQYPPIGLLSVACDACAARDGRFERRWR